MKAYLGFAAFALGLLTGCDLIATGCKTQLNSVIQVDIYDSVTNAPAAGGSTITLDGNSVHDVIVVPDSQTTSFGHLWFEDRVGAGTYTVQVVKAGYRAWTRSDIRIRADRCHTTNSEHVVVRLQR